MDQIPSPPPPGFFDEFDRYLNTPIPPPPPPSVQAPSLSSQQGSHTHTEGTSNTTTTSTRVGRTTSHVWPYFTKEDALPNPKKPNVPRFNCICKLCGEKGKMVSFKYSQTGGTGTLSRHLDTEHGIVRDRNTGEVSVGGVGQTQTQLGGYMSEIPGGGTPFSYNKSRMVSNLARYVILDELPFSHGESPNLEDFNRLSLNPAYRSVPRNNLKYEITKQYKLARNELIEFFRTYDGHVAITSDTWSSKQGEPFLCITAHWIDKSYILQKRIIAFDVMDESHNGYNIYSRINQTLIDFNLRDKLFTISFDNATANTKCIEHVLAHIPLLLEGKLLHVRCCAHIVNLSAQEGVSQLQPLLTPIRNVVKWLRNTGSIKRKFKTMCLERNIKPRKFSLDTPTRWNSTYKLLIQAIKFREIVTKLYNEHHAEIGSGLFISEGSWNVAQHVCNLLKTYYDATLVFSLVYEPNVHLVIMECVKIVMMMSQCEEDEPNTMGFIIDEMKKKWLTYFDEFPMIYSIACLLDPGVKSIGLKNILDYYYSCLNISYNVQRYVDSCVDTLQKLYDIYANDSGSSEASSSSQKTKKGRFDHLANIIFRKPSNVNSSSSSTVINDYLSSTHETDSEDFNILSWWCDHSSQYPILAKLARDILVVPASTIASESAFSAGRRVLDEKRSSLAPDSIKMCVCKKDWDQAAKRQQGMKESDSEDDPWMVMDGSTGSSTHNGQDRE